MSVSFTPEPRSRVIRRRLLTISRSTVFLLLLVVLAPVAIPLALLVDGARWLLTRKPAMTIRLMAFGYVFFSVELLGLLRLAASWLRNGFGRNLAQLQEEAWSIQAWWARTLLQSATTVFQLEFLVKGQEQARPGPILVLFRHASIVDNLLPAVLITDQLGIKLRWIIKRELLAVPSLDVAGKRLPNYFVDRASADPRTELRRIRALAENLGAADGILIYPEGTRFTRDRLRRALQRMRQADDRMVQRAEQLQNVMPPRPGGTLALLDSGADVIIGAHVGLEGFAKLSDLWSGALVGRNIEVELRRIPAESIPRGRAARAEWLYDVWENLDGWIAERNGP